MQRDNHIKALIAGLTFLAFPVDAGPWMRDSGAKFLAYSGTAAITMETGQFQQGFDLYFESGLRPNLTFGAEVSTLSDSDARFLGFVQKPIQLRSDRFKLTYQLGLGAKQSGGIWSPILRGSLHVGKGFEHKWGAGWMSLAASIEADTGRDVTLAKLDTTFGLTPHDRLKTMLQVRLDKATGGDTGVAIAPSVAWTLKRNQHLFIELEARQATTTRYGIKIGIWKDF